MKHSIIIFLYLMVQYAGFAQALEDDRAVMQPIVQLFQGMNLGDSAMVHRSFAPEVSFVTLGSDKSGKPFMRTERSLKNFLTAIGSPHPEVWSEPIWDVKIQRDGSLAQVWANYAFYIGKKFSHCGVDAFQLARDEKGMWKIFHLADTRQREGCQIPEAIAAQFK
jgi:hypothetical protein